MSADMGGAGGENKCEANILILFRKAEIPWLTLEFANHACKNVKDREFPGSPVVRTPRFHGPGTKILQATQRGQKKKSQR